MNTYSKIFPFLQSKLKSIMLKFFSYCAFLQFFAYYACFYAVNLRIMLLYFPVGREY